MARNFLTDNEVEIEIERLKHNEYVKLAKKEERIRYRRRQYLYALRAYERMGRKLAEGGVTMESLEALDCEEGEA